MVLARTVVHDALLGAGESEAEGVAFAENDRRGDAAEVHGRKSLVGGGSDVLLCRAMSTASAIWATFCSCCSQGRFMYSQRRRSKSIAAM